MRTSANGLVKCGQGEGVGKGVFRERLLWMTPNEVGPGGAEKSGEESERVKDADYDGR